MAALGYAETLQAITWFVWVGVQIFFVISGYTIPETARSSSVTKFVQGRFIRLYPAAWICATTTFIFLTIASGTPSIDAYVRLLTLWLWGPWIDGAYWTLPIELRFYSLIVALLSARQFERIHLVALPLTASSGGYLLMGALGFDLSSTSAVLNFLYRNSHLLLLKNGCLFATGIWLWLLSQHRILVLVILGLALSLTARVLQIFRVTEQMVAFNQFVANYRSVPAVIPQLFLLLRLD